MSGRIILRSQPLFLQKSRSFFNFTSYSTTNKTSEVGKKYLEETVSSSMEDYDKPFGNNDELETFLEENPIIESKCGGDMKKAERYYRINDAAEKAMRRSQAYGTNPSTLT